jgi:Pyruvate:ferredoxin oxidoreductase and related 2-oxoacid:ferredoxin oxidoreductases, alpha subunit
VPVYPITPQTSIVQKFASFVADGKVDTEIINVESEHSAMSAAIGAALAGARTITATSSQGLALMAEVVYIAAAMRAPILVAIGNRALSGPINIHADHSDSMLVRDSGVIQLFAENAQEAYELMLLGTRLAEHPDVLLPVFVCQDGFTITHSAEPVTLLDDEVVREFVGEYSIPFPLLDTDRPTSQGTFAMPDYYFEFRHHLDVAMDAAREVLRELSDELSASTGRSYPAFEEYELAGAERVVIAMGSTAGTAKDVVDELRAAGDAVGLVRIVSFRPFPADELRSALASTHDVFVLDRAASAGAAAPLFAEVAAALYGSSTALRSHVYGLGGRDLGPEGLREVFAGNAPAYIGLRSEPCPA